jgi:uroporphyrinogen decarboxylase
LPEEGTVTELKPFLRDPAPDFDRLERILRGELQSRKAHIIELAIDPEVLTLLREHYLGLPWVPLSGETREAYYAQLVDLYWRLGYDALLEGVWRTTWVNHPDLGSPGAADTAGELARGRRDWAREGRGLIASWESFERFPWERITVDYRPYEILARELKPGMKLYASSSFFEHVLENLLGYEGLFYALADQPDLVEAVFNRWGEKVLEYYRNVVSLEGIGAVWHADDLGYKTGTILSPADLARYVFPWLVKFARVAHDHGKLFILHSCGNYFENGVLESLLSEVGVDALHSFQDVILPVEDCAARYGRRLALLGGVDVDLLGRGTEEGIRARVRRALQRCLPGRFALGSGNTIANYIPLHGYLAMLDEVRLWNAEQGSE